MKKAKDIKTKQNFVTIKLVLLILLLTFCGYGIFQLHTRSQQSDRLKTQADTFIKQGKPEEAIILYQEAYALFPFRPSIIQDLEGARLILQSDLDYGKIYDIDTAEYQQQLSPAQQSLAEKLSSDEISVPILMYHHIRINPRPNDPVWAALNVTPENLDDQIHYLVSNNYHIVTLSDLYEALRIQGTLPSHSVVLTFDDGYRSFYDNVFPILKKYSIKVDQFVITQAVGASAYLTWDEIKEMDATGLVEWGGHTRHHPDLTTLSNQAMIDEITGSKSDLEEHLGRPITWFAYPYGSYNEKIVQTVKNAGFIGAVSTIYGSGQSMQQVFLLKRIMVDGRYTLDAFIARLPK